MSHNFTGHNSNGKVGVNGSYDVNIWYSYDNNSKTNVIARNFNYNDTINVKLNNNETLTDANEIIVRSLSAPSTVDVKTEGNSLKIIIEKELGVEIVGDVKLRINVLDDYDDYDEDIIVEDNEIQIDENYLNSVNQK